MTPKKYIIALFATVMLLSCTENKKEESLPAKPKDVNSVQTLIKGKKYTTKKLGFYDIIFVDGEKGVKWIDVAEKQKPLAKNPDDNFTKMELEPIEEELKFGVQFVNDTAATVFVRDTSFAASYVVNDGVGQYDEVKEGIKIRLTYTDPSFSFGGGEPMEMTVTYVVIGADDKRLLVQTPRSIDRKPLISLLKAE